MKYKLLIIEDDKDFLRNLKKIVKIQMQKYQDSIEFEVIFASYLSEVSELIDKHYYIGCSIDQNIPKNEIIAEHEDYGVEASKTIKKGNVLIYPIMYTSYHYNINFNSVLNISKMNYLNKNDCEIDEWAKKLIDNTREYIASGIFDDAVDYLPFSLGEIIDKYRISSDEESKTILVIHFFELALKMFYGSVMATIGKNIKPQWINAKMIDRLKDISQNINRLLVKLEKLQWSSEPTKLTLKDFYYQLNDFCNKSNIYSLNENQKIQINKLLNSELFESLDKLRAFRNSYERTIEKPNMDDEVKYHFINILLHTSYFYTNPIIYINKTSMRNNKLEINSTEVLGNGNRFEFIQESGEFVNEYSLYQIFDKDTTTIINVDNYFEKDKEQRSLILRIK